MRGKLRKGLIVFNRNNHKDGVVIDWGLRKDPKRYIPLIALETVWQTANIMSDKSIVCPL